MSFSALHRVPGEEPIFGLVNLIHAGLATPDLFREVAGLVPHCVRVQKRGRGPGSLEPEHTAGLDYRVLDGAAIQAHAPWLEAFYLSPVIAELFAWFAGSPLVPSADVSSRLNLNVLSRKGERYERHVDAQPYTALLFASESGLPWAGGRFHLRLDWYDTVLKPVLGDFVVFDGSRVEHWTDPLEVDWLRLTVPMHYVRPGEEARDPSLSDYLFSPTEGA